MTTTHADDLPLPVVAPPDLPSLVDEAAAIVLRAADETGADPVAMAKLAADDITSSGRWRVDDLLSAEWAMRQVAHAEAHLAELRAARDAYVRQIDDWYERATVRHRVTHGLMCSFLDDYMRRRRKADERAKSLPLPSGTVKSSQYQPAIEVDDEEALIAWLEAQGLAQCVRVKKSVVLSELKKVARPVVHEHDDVTDDGEVVKVIVDSYVEADCTVDGEVVAVHVPGCHVRAGHLDVKVVAGG